MALNTEKLFAQLNLEYLKRSRIQSSRFSDYEWGKSPYYEANKPEFEDLTYRYGDLIRDSYLAPLEIKQVSKGVGLGVFSLSDLPLQAFIGEYSGNLREAVETSPEDKINGHYLSDYAWNYPDELPDGTEFEIDAFFCGNELRFVNHSYSPNCVVDHTLVDGFFVTFFRVISPIKKGQQLLIDYGEEYWSGGFRTLEEL